LRRGSDHQLFNPARRNRAWLAATYGIPEDRVVVICAGRLNHGKNVMLLAKAMAALVARSVDAQLLCAGEGDDRATIRHCLGPRATCPGNVEPAELARLYASADLFAFPSRIEEAANVVLEALASGLPVLVTEEGGMGRLVGADETGLVLSGEDAAPWIEAIAALASEPERRRQMGRSARCRPGPTCLAKICSRGGRTRRASAKRRGSTPPHDCGPHPDPHSPSR
jgi:glycosyltransferase involved in cell wall biosynthesis